MSFDTVTFWLFFAVAWCAWRWLPFDAAKSAALLASLVFYAWWSPWYLLLIGASALVDFVAARRIAATASPGARRGWLVLSLVVNLGLLAVFKYAPLLGSSAARVVTALGAAREGALDAWSLAGWVVPVGISFYTFQTLSYSLDVYHRRAAPCGSFRDFLLYVAFFPQLVAGPIVRARQLLPQLLRRRRPRWPSVQLGLYRIVGGLFLKLVVADNLAPFVERTFDMTTLPQAEPARVWIGVTLFAVQIFADFAGYSSIAIGLAHLMGLRFPDNFLYPYLSRGLSEFWGRWHVTLSSWLRDYLYVPLGGSRRGPSRTLVALMLTMVLGGLWHGAAWTFVAWGALHGVGLCVERAVRGERRPRGPAGRPSGVGDALARLAQTLVVLLFVLTTWVFFRSDSFAMAATALQRMWAAPWREGLGDDLPGLARPMLLVLPVVVLHAGQLAHEWFGLRKSAWLRAAACGVMLFLLAVVRRDATQEFIYFQF